MSNPYRDKLLSIQLSPQATPSRELKNYYDKESVEEVFGTDATQRMLENTHGLGPAHLAADGEFYRRDRNTQEWTRVTDTEADQIYLSGDSEE